MLAANMSNMTEFIQPSAEQATRGYPWDRNKRIDTAPHESNILNIFSIYLKEKQHLDFICELAGYTQTIKVVAYVTLRPRVGNKILESKNKLSIAWDRPSWELGLARSGTFNSGDNIGHIQEVLIEIRSPTCGSQSANKT